MLKKKELKSNVTHEFLQTVEKMIAKFVDNKTKLSNVSK